MSSIRARSLSKRITVAGRCCNFAIRRTHYSSIEMWHPYTHPNRAVNTNPAQNVIHAGTGQKVKITPLMTIRFSLPFGNPLRASRVFDRTFRSPKRINCVFIRKRTVRLFTVMPVCVIISAKPNTTTNSTQPMQCNFVLNSAR